MTIEGIGDDATINGFGFLLRNAGNVEMRNFSIINFMDDGISSIQQTAMYGFTMLICTMVKQVGMLTRQRVTVQLTLKVIHSI